MESNLVFASGTFSLHEVKLDADMFAMGDFILADHRGEIRGDPVFLLLAASVWRLVETLGFSLVSEADIRAYYEAAKQGLLSRPVGSVETFLMEPIVKTDEKTGAVITYAGPYHDTGMHGYEIGVWWNHPKEPGGKAVPKLFPRRVATHHQLSFYGMEVVAKRAA